MNTERVTDRQAFEEALREDQIAEDNACRQQPAPEQPGAPGAAQ